MYCGAEIAERGRGSARPDGIVVLEMRVGANQNGNCPSMNRNLLYLVIGALVVAALVLSYYFYQERQNRTSIEINVGKGGISVETK